MTPAVATHHVQRLRQLILQRLGLVFDDSTHDVVAGALSRRLEARRCSAEDYLLGLGMQPYPGDEWRRLAEILTVTETYFFRNADQIRAFLERSLPAPGVQTVSPLRVLSAACASGEEPYSLALAVREARPGVDGLVSLSAIDLNPAMLAKARRGVYSNWSLRNVSAVMRARSFRRDGGEFLLDTEIRSQVKFEERNLLLDDASLWRPHSWDVVFCRNVIMYFEPDTARAVVARIARSLVPGGLLFLGHAETLRGLSDEFEICHSHDTFYYRRQGVPADRAAGGPPPIVADAAQIFDRPPPAPARVALPELTDVLASLSSERYAEALLLLNALPDQQAHAPSTLLLRAITLVHLGTLEAAEDTCRQLIALDERNAGAHYVLALCHEGHRDIRRALDEDRKAADLDPDFAMAQVHSGLLSRRLGETSSARRMLRQAMEALAREEAARLAVFGGGFNRDALLALCRAELSACGEEV
jgi:chemotaxis protein methyltransferase CheR